jgi:hypothetical protein
VRAPASLVGSEQLEIRSFRVVFALERRLFRIDRWRLPLPYGVPVRGIGYAAAALLAVLVVGSLPGIGLVVEALPAPLRLVILPVAIAAIFARLRVDGRPAHRFLAALLRHRLGPSTLDAFQPVPRRGSVHRMNTNVLLADGLDAADYRPGRIKGPATVVLGLPASARQRGRRLELTPTQGRPLRRPKRISLKPGQSLVIR